MKHAVEIKIKKVDMQRIEMYMRLHKITLSKFFEEVLFEYEGFKDFIEEE